MKHIYPSSDYGKRQLNRLARLVDTEQAGSLIKSLRSDLIESLLPPPGRDLFRPSLLSKFVDFAYLGWVYEKTASAMTTLKLDLTALYLPFFYFVIFGEDPPLELFRIHPVAYVDSQKAHAERVESRKKSKRESLGREPETLEEMIFNTSPDRIRFPREYPVTIHIHPWASIEDIKKFVTDHSEEIKRLQELDGRHQFRSPRLRAMYKRILRLKVNGKTATEIAALEESENNESNRTYVEMNKCLRRAKQYERGDAIS